MEKGRDADPTSTKSSPYAIPVTNATRQSSLYRSVVPDGSLVYMRSYTVGPFPKLLNALRLMMY